MTFKELVKQSGYSREEIAVAVKKSKQTVDNWCWEHNKPSAKSCQILAELFEMSVEDVIAMVFPEE